MFFRNFPDQKGQIYQKSKFFQIFPENKKNTSFFQTFQVITLPVTYLTKIFRHLSLLRDQLLNRRLAIVLIFP